MHDNVTDKVYSDTKSKIFSTAARLFAQKGYDGVSMREISEQSGVTKPTIYYYFGSKDGIYRELVDTGIQYVYSSFEIANQANTSAIAKLVLMTKNIFKLTTEFPEFAKFFMTIVTPLSDHDILNKFKKEAMRRGKVLVDVINQGINSGEFGASANPELAAKIIGGVWQHFIWQQLAVKKKILTDRLAEEVIEILFKGLNE